MGGAEKVLEALAERFEGPIYTLIQDKKALQKTPFAGRRIETSFLQRIPKSPLLHKHLAPLLPMAIQRLDLSAHRWIISSSFAVAKSIVKRPDQLHICYCHTPMRSAWDLYEFYLSTLSLPARFFARPTLRYLRHFDRRTHVGVDHFIANSHCVAKRIEEHYGRRSTVIHPPVSVERFAVCTDKQDYYITCSRLVPYKRVDLLVKAFAQLPNRRLLIVGEGEQRRRLQAKAPANVSFLGHVSETAYPFLLSAARAFLFAAEEDFGIAMAEASAAGVPIIAYGKGGSTDVVLPGQTGLFFHEQTSDAVRDALLRFEKMEPDFEPEGIRAHAQKFSKERFVSEIECFVSQCVG